MCNSLFAQEITEDRELLSIPDYLANIQVFDATAHSSQWIKAGYYDESNPQYTRDILPDGLDSINVVTFDYVTTFGSNPADITNGNYTNAIDWYDNLLNNDPSAQDSIYAAIDLGFIFLLMEEDSNNEKHLNKTLKANSENPVYSQPFWGKLSKFAPTSRNAYKLSQLELLDQLFSLHVNNNI